jgi:PAS domain-containing protein
MGPAEDRLAKEAGSSLVRRNERDTYFGWVGRDGLDELRSASKLLQGAPLMQQILDAMPIPVSVLNDKGQIVLMNRSGSQALGTTMDCALGKRHGELLGCVHSKEGPEGCCTTRHCENCGAFVSIEASRRTKGQVVREYHLDHETPTGRQEEDLVVTCTPIRVEGRDFTIFAVQDASPHRGEDRDVSLGV